jgi:hypothetical protein
MVANVDVFGGVNATCLKQATASTKQEFENEDSSMFMKDV